MTSRTALERFQPGTAEFPSRAAAETRRGLRLAPAALLVFALAFVALGWKIQAAKIAAAATDPFVPILAQDEPGYVSAAMRMAEEHHWLTPKVLGRFVLTKPPLLEWLSALSIQLLGLGLLSLRLPSLLFGAAAAAIVFAWAGRRNRTGGAAAALLLVSDPIWLTFSRLCYTDVLASSLALLAMYALVSDPLLVRRRWRTLFGVFAGGAVMAKSIVGVLPFLALALFAALMPSACRPRVRHCLQTLAVAASVAAPWHLYQIAVHPAWFWADFVRHQLLAVGVTEATGVTGYPLFYIRRLLAMDPVLCGFAALAAAGAWRTWVKRERIGMIAVCWTLTVIAALALFRGRSVSYLVLLVPGLCVASGLFLPTILQRAWPLTLAALAVLFSLKVEFGDHAWSLRYTTPRVESAAAMRWYRAQDRDSELIIAEPGDQFYSMTLGLPRLRYCFVNAQDSIAAVAPHVLRLGIAVSARQFAGLPALLPSFSERLAAWGLYTDEPVATTITLDRPEDMLLVMRARPGADFDIPAAWESFMPRDVMAAHEIVPAANRVFLLARGAGRVASRQPLPAGW